MNNNLNILSICSSFIRKSSGVILLFSVLILFLVLPHVNIPKYAHATVTSKFIIFIYSCLIILAVYLLHIVSIKFRTIQVSKFDISLFVLLIFITLNRYVLQSTVGFSIRYIELIGMSFLYIVLRGFSTKYFIWLLLAIVVSGITQAVYGNLQLLGYYASNHSGFKMTGSFFNPGPYAGFLVSVWPIALGIYLFKDKIIKEIQSQINNDSIFTKFLISTLFEYIPLIGIISILLVLPASQSRAAWLAMLISSSILIEIRYVFLKSFFRSMNQFKKTVLVIVLVTILSAGLFGVYHFKKGSSDGRLLIWKISTEMIKESPVFGFGFDRFKANYMNSQANYFVKNSGTKEAIFADNTYYAFNEILQFVSENGFSGLLLLLILCYYILNIEVSEINKTFFSIVKTNILAIAVFACFSYPMQILPIKLILVLLLALLANIDINKKKLNIFRKKEYKHLRWSFKTGILIVGIMIVYFGFKNTLTYDQSFKKWKNALMTYQYGDYRRSIRAYKTVYPIFKNDGEFLMNYGKALSMEKQHKFAIQILEQAKQYLNTTIVETALGDSYKGLEQYKNAEIAYQHAANMIPGRFYPNYLLAKLYAESNQNRKAICKAKELLIKEIKIPSTAIKEMHAEMVELLKATQDK